jgi:squalene-hopene/tetraprenyl-beta-curcumene cyclase
MILLPSWCPFNIYSMSSWTRTIVVPLSVLWAHRPVRDLPRERGIRELFLRSPSRCGGPQPPPHSHDTPWKPTERCLTWDRLFLTIDAALKQLERLRVRPLRRRALRVAERWMLERFEQCDGLGAIFPPIVWSVVALRCLGYADESPEVTAALKALEGLYLHDEPKGSTRLQPCLSPVWDTALSTLALSEAGVSSDELPVVRAVDWLLSKEVRRPGDWSVRNPHTEPGGWFFEFENAFYPDVDDTAMVLMALDRATPGDLVPSSNGNGQANGRHLGNGRSLSHDNGRAPEMAAVWAGQASGLMAALPKVEKLHRVVAAKNRALAWLLSMQNRDGGWAAFDRDNDFEVLTRVPFADHNAMIDPSSSDLTGRALELLGRFGLRRGHVAVDAAVEYLLQHQEDDGTWLGRWGVNYIYGTWQALVGLVAVGFQVDDPAIQAGARWLVAAQQSCGGWGESPRSYDEPDWKGRGEPTVSQTAWALMGLIAAQGDRDAVERGVRYLLETQNADGTWDEPQFTGTGFPRVFYLKYHLYRVYFPLMALARYRRTQPSSVPDRVLASSQAAGLLASR